MKPLQIIELWIEEEKKEIHTIIRQKRNNIIELISKHQENLPVMELINLNKYKAVLDTIDYLLDKEE